MLSKVIDVLSFKMLDNISSIWKENPVNMSHDQVDKNPWPRVRFQGRRSLRGSFQWIWSISPSKTWFERLILRFRPPPPTSFSKIRVLPSQISRASYAPGFHKDNRISINLDVQNFTWTKIGISLYKQDLKNPWPRVRKSIGSFTGT